MKILFLSSQLFLLSALYGRHVNSFDSFPPPGGSFVYHPKTGTMLLLGGSAAIPDSVRSNVWSWNGSVWSEIRVNGPGSRDFFPAILDLKTGLISSFGGIGQANDDRKGDLWRFDGSTWTKVMMNDIGSRDHHSMVYADHLDAIVLYGGQNSSRNFDSATWLFKNGAFTPLRIPGPGVRYHSAMAYDKQRKKVVLYGGGEHPDEHWEFDGKQWARIITTENPGKRFYHSMVYDDNLKKIVLHGGWRNQNPRDSINSLTPTTWAWDGTTWKKIAEQKVFAATMGYDVKRKLIVAFGRTESSPDAEMGLWELRNGSWVMKAQFGKWSPYEYVKKWVRQHPDDIRALAKYADMLQWQTKEFAEAEIAYKRILAAEPGKTRLLTELALVLLMQGKVEEADGYLANANEAGLINRNAYTRLAGLLRMEKRYRESAIYLEKALQLDPKGNDFYDLACNYANINNKDKAFENLNKAADNGFNVKQSFEQSTELASLKDDSRWQELLKKLK